MFPYFVVFVFFLHNDFFAAYVFYLPFVCIANLHHLSCLTGILREFILNCKMAWNLFILASAEPFFYLLCDLHVSLASLHSQGTVSSPYQSYDYMKTKHFTHRSRFLTLPFLCVHVYIYFPMCCGTETLMSPCVYFPV